MMITTSMQVSKHFHSTEFVCEHCGRIKIDENLIVKMENLFSRLNASKCIISSGYRCPTHDIEVGGFAGRHSEGLASDCIYYDKDGKAIPSRIVCCVAWDLMELNGIARIDDYYVHLDNRQNGYYHGDEPRGNDNFWDNPYTYFGVTKAEVAKYTGEEVGNKDYRTLYNMNVRSGAGDNHHIKKVKELTADGRKNALFTGDDDYAIYKKGTVFTALEIINNEYGKWAKTPSGYVCIKGSDGITYSEKI
ncbi:MAG: hypothetical protein J6T23_02330 [Elusimicrobia bacterium]|nr:hypothetical protein [Elusimicrobiota bacterium]